MMAAGLLMMTYAQAQTLEWSITAMDGSRTGVVASSAENVPEAMGRMKGKTYIAPNGKQFKKGVTPKVAAMMLAVQDEMAPVKTVIGHSAKEMVKKSPESELSNWTVDTFMELAKDKFGKHVDAGIVNLGGIRVNMPGGDILLDDILSMFPFNNTVCLVSMKGNVLRGILEQMAAHSFQAVGGMRIVAQNGKLVSVEVAGAPLDDERVYNIATISFLLNGGDGFSLAKDAVEVLQTKEYVRDLIVPYIKRLEAAGKIVDASMDGRVRILDSEGNPMPVVEL